MPSLQNSEIERGGEPDQETKASALEAAVPATGAPKKPAAVFQLPPGKYLGLCSAPILHGLDESGAKIWSKTFLDGRVSCSEAETGGLVQLRIEHPYLRLGEAVRFSYPPTGLVNIRLELFGDCRVKLTGLRQSDLQAHLVVRNLDRESYLDAVINGRSRVIVDFQDLRFERLPVGRYIVALFREDPFRSSGEPYYHRIAGVRLCQETVIELSGEAGAQVGPGRSGKQGE